MVDGSSFARRIGLPAERRPDLVPPFVRAMPPAADGALALFDADGTLWTDDVADDFTRWMIDEGRIPGGDWPTYMRVYRDDAPAGCRYLLTLYRGLALSELSELVSRWWVEHAHRRWIAPAVEALHHLADRGYEVWIVTGSPTETMIPLLDALPVRRIVGMDFEVIEGRITGRHTGISCAGEGKAEKVAALAGGRPIAFCAGNGELDEAMMRLADRAWAVYPNPAFRAAAEAAGWPILPRPADFVEEEKFLLAD